MAFNFENHVVVIGGSTINIYDPCTLDLNLMDQLGVGSWEEYIDDKCLEYGKDYIYYKKWMMDPSG